MWVRDVSDAPVRLGCVSRIGAALSGSHWSRQQLDRQSRARRIALPDPPLLDVGIGMLDDVAVFVRGSVERRWAPTCASSLFRAAI